MKKRSSLRVLFLAALFLGLTALPLEAQSFFSRLSWSASGSIFFFPEDNGLRSDPMPILPSLGMGVAYPFFDGWKAEMTLDLYFTHYGYDFVLDRAVPYAVENRSSFVIGSVLGFQAVRTFEVSSIFDIRAFAGPAFDLRMVFVAEDLTNELPEEMADIRRQTNAVRDYFWSKGRWFLPVLGSGMDFRLNSKIKLGVDFRVWFPVYKLWSGEDLPPIEGWRFGVGARISFI